MKIIKSKKNLRVVILLTLLAGLSCNRVNFSSKTEDPPPDPTPTTTVPAQPLGAITCDVYLNNHLQSLTITLPGVNPTVTASCTPSSVTYAWSVTKDGTPVTVNGLQGGNSNPDITALGVGTYRLSLSASATGRPSYNNNSNPLTVIVKNAGSTTLPDVTCNPRLNGSLTTVTLGASSVVTAAGNCQPADASCVWTVTLNSTPVSIPGMSGCSPTADFAGRESGDYLIYLAANRSQYNPYISSQPLKVTIPKKTGRSVVTKKDVTVTDNQLDVVVIIDDSKSMLADNQKLAAKLQGFVSDLTASGFDWQMCATVTRAQQISASDPNLYWGASRNWSGVGGASPWILKAGTPNIAQIFANTINDIGAGWIGTDDERAIKAAWWHLWNGDVNYAGNSGCYRKDAGLSVIIISDEDERSIGGDWNQMYYPDEFKTLEEDDQPIHYYNEVRTMYGGNKRFNVNSIIVRPGDNACMASQDAGGSKSHFGYKYNDLSSLTLGRVGSICDADYTANLKYFKDQIVSEMSSLPLECSPIGGTVKVTVSPAFTTATRVEGSTLYFNPKVPAGKTITAEYECAQ